MNSRSDPANSLGKDPGIPRISPLQYDLNASPHLPGRPGIDHLAVVDFTFNSKVTFDSGNRIDYNSFRHAMPPNIVNKLGLDLTIYR